MLVGRGGISPDRRGRRSQNPAKGALRTSDSPYVFAVLPTVSSAATWTRIFASLANEASSEGHRGAIARPPGFTNFGTNQGNRIHITFARSVSLVLAGPGETVEDESAGNEDGRLSRTPRLLLSFQLNDEGQCLIGQNRWWAALRPVRQI